MGYLQGLNEYLDDAYHLSIFDQVLSSKHPWEMHLHNHRAVNAVVTENLKYDLNVKIDGQAAEVLPKVNIKFLYAQDHSASVKALLKVDPKVKSLELDPILSPRDRYHIKNKTLFPLMKERKVVFFKLLEGEIIRGIVDGFSRYEITVLMKGGIPVTILRHSIYDVQDKKGRCFLKSAQEHHKDWEKSEFFVPAPSPTKK